MFSLDILLNIIKLSRSTYNYHLRRPDTRVKNHNIKTEIQAIFTVHKRIMAVVECFLN